MIPLIKKFPAFLPAVILSLSLCNTATVFATGSISNPVSSLQSGRETAVSTPSPEQQPMDRTEPEQEPSADGGQTEALLPEQETSGTLPPEGEEEMPKEIPEEMASPGDSILMEADIVRKEAATVWKEAATVDELKSLLEDEDWVNAGGGVRVTEDLIIPVYDNCMLWPNASKDMPLVVDLGTHTLYVEGWLRSFGNIKYIGDGGENGLIHIRTGGRANISSAVFAVTEEGGYAIWQEDESILSYEPASGSVGEIRFAEPSEKEVSTFEELALLLDDEYWKANGGYITVTDNLVVPAGEEHKFGWIDSKALTTLDMGKHTLSVEGTLDIYEWVKLIGAGGENGLLRVKTGGSASVWPAALTAEEDGYAIWQEEGSLLEYSSNENNVGKVHFAQNPVAVPFSAVNSDAALPVVLVYDGQTPEDVLPVTDNVRLYWQGVMDQGTNDTDKLISVVWDLNAYQTQLDAGKRVLITGSYPEAVAFQAPVCLVVFQNGNPAVFLNSYGAKARNQPIAIVNVWLEEPELGCRFEWSQDGVTWHPAEFTSNTSGELLSCKVTFPQEEPPSYPYYLSAVVDYPDGSAGYSEVIVFNETDKACDSGGNRGGGTDIIDSPNVLNPNPTDHSYIGGGPGQEPESQENAGDNESGSPKPDATPGSKPEQSAKPDITPNPVPDPPDQSDTTSAREESENSKPEAKPESTIPLVEEISGIHQAALPAGAEPERQASLQILSETESEASNAKPEDAGRSPLAKAVPIVIGGTAAAAAIGAAGVYHSVSLRKRLWAVLKKLIRIKK